MGWELNDKTNTDSDHENDSANSFLELANQKRPSITAEFIDFLIHNKKWWITPILIVLFLVGILAALTASPIAPFIYPFF